MATIRMQNIYFRSHFHKSYVTNNASALFIRHPKNQSTLTFAIYAKSAQLNSVFCLNLEFLYHFPPRMVESPPD